MSKRTPGYNWSFGQWMGRFRQFAAQIRTNLLAAGTGVANTFSAAQTFSAQAIFSLGFTNLGAPLVVAVVTGAHNDSTGDGTTVAVSWDAEKFDQANNFSSNTFTAPYTGKYLVLFQVTIVGYGALHTEAVLLIDGSAFDVYLQDIDIGAVLTGAGRYTLAGSVIIPMTAADTFSPKLTVSGSTKTVDYTGSATDYYTWIAVQQVA